MAVEVSIGSRVGEDAGASESVLFHGTSVESATSLLLDPRLDFAKAAAAKIDGPPGFFLAASPVDAEYFALRRSPGAVLRYRFFGPALGD